MLISRARWADAAPRPLLPSSANESFTLGRPRQATTGPCNREATMNRKIGIVFATGVVVAAFAGTASAQNSTGTAAIDASLRGAVERKDVPGVVALITDRKGVIYQGAFGVADVSTGRPLAADSLFR